MDVGYEFFVRLGLRRGLRVLRGLGLRRGRGLRVLRGLGLRRGRGLRVLEGGALSGPVFYVLIVRFTPTNRRHTSRDGQMRC